MHNAAGFVEILFLGSQSAGQKHQILTPEGGLISQYGGRRCDPDC